MVQTADSQPIRHLNERNSAWLQHAVDLRNRLFHAVFREMLQHAVTEHHIETMLRKWNDLAGAASIIDIQAELLGHSPSGENGLRTGVDPRDRVPLLRCGNRPATPIAANVQKTLAAARIQAKFRDGVSREPELGWSIQEPVRVRDALLNERVDLLANLAHPSILST